MRVQGVYLAVDVSTMQYLFGASGGNALNALMTKLEKASPGEHARQELHADYLVIARLSEASASVTPSSYEYLQKVLAFSATEANRTCFTTGTY